MKPKNRYVRELKIILVKIIYININLPFVAFLYKPLYYMELQNKKITTTILPMDGIRKNTISSIKTTCQPATTIRRHITKHWAKRHIVDAACVAAICQHVMTVIDC